MPATAIKRQLEAVLREPGGRQLARCLLRRGRYIIGQEKRNEIVVDEPSVSGRHARLTVITEDEIVIEDLGSSNGTTVDDRPAGELAAVTVRSRVKIGNCTLEFQRGGLPAAVFDQLPEGFLRPNRYNFGELVVEGRTSRIYQAADASLRRSVAIKVMRTEAQSEPDYVMRFIREAQIGSQLEHSGILPVYEISMNEESQLFYTTRFVEGVSLAALLDALASGDAETAHRWPLHALLAVFQRLCDTIAYAHSRGVVHGGIRTECVDIGKFGEVFIVGWSLATLVKSDASGERVRQPLNVVSAKGSQTVSPCSAPEQFAAHPAKNGEPPAIDARTDVFALGAILYHILALHPAAIGSSEEELARQTLGGMPAAPHACQPALHLPGGEVPPALAAIAMKALNRDPEQRYASASKLQRDVAAWMAAPVQPPQAESPRRNGFAALLARK